MSAARWTIESLHKQHDRAQFDCGQHDLNRFIRQYARQNQEENIGRTYVAVRAGERRVLGFHTLTVASVERDRLAPDEARRLPLYPVPVARLGRLAVDASARGQGLGETLLVHALEVSLRVSEFIGVYVIEVHAKDASAQRFYKRFGFHPLSDDELHLYLSMKAVRRALAGP